MVVEELGQSGSQPELGYVAEVHPPGLGGVVPGLGVRRLQDRDLEVDQHEVVRSVGVLVIGEELDHPDQRTADTFDPGLLQQFPDHGLGQGLPELDPSARKRPGTGGGAVAPPHEQEAVVVHQHRPYGHDRLRHGTSFALRGRRSRGGPRWEGTVDEDRPGREAEAFEEVLGRPVTG